MKSYSVLEEENKLFIERLKVVKENNRYKKEHIKMLEKIISEKDDYIMELLGFIWSMAPNIELTEEQKAKYIYDIREAEDVLKNKKKKKNTSVVIKKPKSKIEKDPETIKVYQEYLKTRKNN